ncbi:unnamed protein product [Phytophthora fragariaefolia]|uniref:Unnamed protein product n=1 Tax=Phytophthora fragariaefolia TaxID=1490495 RepID=A0A9W6X818_9STRA|nr:unnamed protein product [Phytophthora fragariaefolia]
MTDIFKKLGNRAPVTNLVVKLASQGLQYLELNSRILVLHTVILEILENLTLDTFTHVVCTSSAVMTSVVPMPPELAEISAAALNGCLEATRAPPSPASLRRIMIRGGQALQSVLSSAPSTASAISPECQEALQRMTDSGHALEMRFVIEIENCGVLAECAAPRLNDLEDDAVKHLAELREVVSSAAMATLATKPNVDLLALWSVVHTSVSASITEEAATFAAQVEAELPDAVEEIEDSMVSIGRLLQVALLTSAAFAGTVGAEVRAGIDKLVREGVPLADNLVQELKSHIASIRDALSEEDWQEFTKLCAQSFSTGWQELGEGASKLSEAVNIVTQVEVDKIFNSPFATAIAARSSALATGTLAYSRDFVEAALDAARDGRAFVLTGFFGWVEHMGLPPLLRVEIARDYFQTAGLFFAGLFVPVIADFWDSDIGSGMRKILWGFSRFYNVFAMDASAFLQVPTTATNVFVVFLIVGILAVWVSYLWFLKTGRHMHSRVVEVRHGHEATTWAALAVRQATRVKLFTYVITACLTVYLPLTRLCLDVLAASAAPAMDNEDFKYGATDLVIARMKNSSGWWLAVVMAVVVLVSFTFTLPWAFYNAIKKNQPTGSHENVNMTHNLDGEKVEFTDKVYARLVARDPSQLRCPYRSLYAGFGQRSSHYKVVQLGVKIALAFLVVCTTRSRSGLRGGLICALYIFVVLFTVKGKPFTDPMNNVQEISSKVAAFSTCFCASVIIGSNSLRGWGGFAVFVQVLNMIVMISVLMLGMKRTRLWIKNKTGFLTFSDTSRGIEDARAVDIVPEWNPEKEAKHRVWQAFWRATLLELTEPKLGKDYSGITIANRLADLEQAVVASGAHRVVSHWKGEENPYTVRLRRAALEVLEGVDVFWGDLNNPHSGHSGFGKMYVKPYPFHCVIVYDDPVKSAVGDAGVVVGEPQQDVITLRDDYDANDSSSTHTNLAKLFFLNFSPRIIARREVRQKLRALSALATSIRFPFVQEEEVTLEDGIVEIKRFGKTYTETRMTKVKFKCYYTWGVIRVETEGDGHGKQPRIMAEGFNVTMTYRDGQGEAVAPNTGIVHSLKHRETTKGPEHIGLTSEMEGSEKLRRIFSQTEPDWTAGVEKLRSQDQQYRRRLEEKYRRGNETLSDGFWYEVYNQPHISRSKLEHHLRVQEINPQLRALPRTHADALDSLYLRMRYIYSHPAVTFWYIFWEDVYARNGEMRRLQDHKALLDPLERTSLCYRVMKRGELEVCLEARQLLGRKGYFVPRLLQLRFELVDPTKVHLPQRLFDPQLLDLLYDTLNKHIDAAKQGKTTSEVEDEGAKEKKSLDIRDQIRNALHIDNDKTNEQRDAADLMLVTSNASEVLVGSSLPPRAERRVWNWKTASDKLQRAWLGTQLSHRGKYSIERLIALDEYVRSTTWPRVLLLCLTTPIPTVVLVLSQESVPLHDPSKGWRVNYGIWIRAGLVSGAVCHSVLVQLQHLVDDVAISKWQLAAILIVMIVGYPAMAVLVADQLFFPIPFMSITMAPLFLLLIVFTFCVVVGGQAVHRVLQHQGQVFYFAMLVITQTLMIIIYPAHQALFQATAHSGYELLVVALLPIMKVTVKNIISLSYHRTQDLMPEGVIFTVDFYNSIYVATSMQNASSTTTVIVIMVVDVIHNAVALNDLRKRASCIMELAQKAGSLSSSDSARFDLLDTVCSLCRNDKQFRRQNCTGIQLRSCLSYQLSTPSQNLLDHLGKFSGYHLGTRLTSCYMSCWKFAGLKTNKTSKTGRGLCGGKRCVPIQPISTPNAHSKEANLGRITPGSFRRSELREVLELLFTVECIVLAEYLKSVVPVLYASYIIIMVRLPSAHYHLEMTGITSTNIDTKVQAIYAYAVLEFVSFLLKDLVDDVVISVQQLGGGARSSRIESNNKEHHFVQLQYDARLHARRTPITLDFFNAFYILETRRIRVANSS